MNTNSTFNQSAFLFIFLFAFLSGSLVCPQVSRAAMAEFVQDQFPKHFMKIFKFEQAPEIYGPTDINAALGNQALSVGVNDRGTITVFRWPRPSFYDQIKYHTTSREQSYFGADPNAGAFLGLRLIVNEKPTVTWLRNWTVRQHYKDGLTDALVTEYRSDTYGLLVTVTDVIPVNYTVTAGRSGKPGTVKSRGGLPGDALLRRIEIKKDESSHIQNTRLIAFENFNLVVSKYPLMPMKDWALESLNTDKARYDSRADAIVHGKSGRDFSTWKHGQTAVSMGFKNKSFGHQVNGDRHVTTPSISTVITSILWPLFPTNGAYEDVNRDGKLSGHDSYLGQTTGALSRSMDLSNGSATARLIFSAAGSPDRATELLEKARSLSFNKAVAGKQRWYRNIFQNAPLPDTKNPDIRALAKRALVTMAQYYDPRSGARVASIATQSPYSLYWVRDSAYINYLFNHLFELPDWVERGNRWFASLQERPGKWTWNSLLMPPNNTWNMAYYSDGVAGGPISWEIDESAYAVWTFWDNYAATGDMEYLKDIYPAIKRAADFIAKYKEESTGLPKPASEDDHFQRSQTIIGASMVWMAMESAELAATEIGDTRAAKRYRIRRKELGTAINRTFWNSSKQAWGMKKWAKPEVAWPVYFRSFNSPRMKKHLHAMWRKVKPTFQQPSKEKIGTGTHIRSSTGVLGITAAEDKIFGLYEPKFLIGLAKGWENRSRKTKKLKRALEWIAEKWATSNTHHMGEVWMNANRKLQDGKVIKSGEVITGVSQPHAWEQALFYIAALEVYPPSKEVERKLNVRQQYALPRK